MAEGLGGLMKGRPHIDLGLPERISSVLVGYGDSGDCLNFWMWVELASWFPWGYSDLGTLGLRV